MIPFTVTIITLNEEENMRACLESVAWAPNILVLDSGSTDRTVEIAREFTPHVHVTDWPGHIQQKQRAADMAPTDWILSIDADERVTPEMRARIEEHLRDTPASSAFSIRRKTFCLGRWILHGGFYPDRRVRLFDRRRARWGGVNPHDHVQVDGRVAALDCDLWHYTYKDVAHHLRTIDSFTDIIARERERRGTPPRLVRMIAKPPAKFVKMFLLQRGFRDGFPGFILAGMGALYVFLKEAKLWERRQLRERGVDPDSLPRYARGPEYRAARAASAK